MSKTKVLKFSAQWCSPCRVLAPIFHRTSKLLEFKNIDFYELDIDDEDNAELVNNYQVRNVPTVLVVDENNEIVKRIVGAVPEPQFVSMLKDAING